MRAKTKKVVLQIHGWLGLVTGLVVFIVSITGCAWVFKEEIEGFLSAEMPIPVQDQPNVTPTEAKILAEAELPGRDIHGVAYGASNDPIEVIFYEYEPVYHRSVFIHPYRAEVLRTVDHRSGFFAWVLDGHQYLWLPAALGTHVVLVSVLLFLVILVSGLLLWWPKNRRAAPARLQFRWKPTTRWRRKNFDLHSVVGFYIYLFAFALAFTGSVMGYGWFYYVVYKSAGGDQNPRFVIPTNVSPVADNPTRSSADRLLLRLQQENPEAESFEIHFPATDTSSIYVEVINQPGVFYNADYRFFDAHSLEELDPQSIYRRYEQASFADKVIRMNYDIHVGSIGGWLGKALAFLASLVTASLPVTGTLLWWGRKKKKLQKGNLEYSERNRHANITS
ncbi:PepSY-associated TM helix domain-containing protein [Tunicatimonas pelagia]|uniref:PepSY-associated TM helix domain-containing protein n=1 Tax=Tunicatimonas pelagia TaxID=931531 RepID=UPI002666903A|nr:PepSY-associated TM helix domain-containing protein [Tunicatimonas pelagia]WKN43000.1 PepSY-associated TM helix domain-containing protein [Tunicatimonas pelagia]